MKTMMHDDEDSKPLGKRFAWFFAIWLASVTTLGVAAYAMRLLMHAAGLTAH